MKDEDELTTLERFTVPGEGTHLVIARKPLTPGLAQLTLVPCEGTGVYRARVTTKGDVVEYKRVSGGARPKGKEGSRA
jgi:hypothetical protein